MQNLMIEEYKKICRDNSPGYGPEKSYFETCTMPEKIFQHDFLHVHIYAKNKIHCLNNWY